MPKNNETPDEFDQDLHPNAGIGGPDNLQEVRTAHELKGAYDHPLLKDLPEDQLKQIIVLPVGSRLEQGSVYIDLNYRHPEEFKAMGDMVA